MRASVIIATYQHAAFLGEAIRSALAQTVPVEVIVVDDGSTDDTRDVLAAFAGNARVRAIHLEHGGPSRARNAGLEAARAEFVMFLDADDVVAPTKVARQLAELDANPSAGWCLCDVRIEDEAKGTTRTASEQYGYAAMELGGWIQSLLVDRNFIPIMSPLVQRSLLSDAIRFDERFVPEDWAFWHAVAGVARVRYVPEVLATYRHRRQGRSRLPKKARSFSPHVTQPLRLNLGCGTQGTRSWHPMPGLFNLDKSMGWQFEEGLGDFLTGSVAAITISHAMMYVALADYPAVFAELARVLAPGGVVRITEDHTAHPESRTYRHGWQGSDPAVSMTSPVLLREHLERAGFAVNDVDCTTTHYRDRSLIQSQHGESPHVFFIEGVKVHGVLFSPHSDDETLFAAFTILRYRPEVVICFPSAGDYGETSVREAETRDAMSVLGAAGVQQWQGGDLLAQMRAYDARVRPARVWAPDADASHPDHVAVAAAAREVFGDRVQAYHTYNAQGKVRRGRQVEFNPEWVAQKMRALLRYKTQIAHPRAHQFFASDLLEYVE